MTLKNMKLLVIPGGRSDGLHILLKNGKFQALLSTIGNVGFEDFHRPKIQD